MKHGLMFAALLLVACGGEPAGDTVGKEIADDYQETLDKARGVEAEAEAAKERIDRALEQADGDTAD